MCQRHKLLRIFFDSTFLAKCVSLKKTNTVEYGYLHHFGPSKFDAKIRLIDANISRTLVVELKYEILMLQSEVHSNIPIYTYYYYSYSSIFLPLHINDMIINNYYYVAAAPDRPVLVVLPHVRLSAIKTPTTSLLAEAETIIIIISHPFCFSILENHEYIYVLDRAPNRPSFLTPLTPSSLAPKDRRAFYIQHTMCIYSTFQ